VQDVEDALRRQNLEVPAGRIESQQREFNVTARTDLNTVAQFSEIALKHRQRLHRCACATWPGAEARPTSARACG
jgi:multidrug efflux pump subunit AcrB